MAQTRVLITVKTYPTLSEKYDELVCTAGFREDGSWIRIYPIPFRKLDYQNQYHKWQWINIAELYFDNSVNQMVIWGVQQMCNKILSTIPAIKRANYLHSIVAC